MATPDEPARPANDQPVARVARVILVSSAMFTFISYWRTAAVVLCDLASTAYYIGGIVEQSIGPAAPWFILAVMLFSYAVRSVYIESCSMFVRGGVYRVVKEAMGSFLAKVSVSALMFDYVLTGPISGVSAGQYLIGLGLETYSHLGGHPLDAGAKDSWKAWGSVIIAIAVTLYFARQNILGIHESSDKALKIMVVTTIMAIILLSWCGLTLAIDGPRNPLPFEPDLNPRLNPATGEMEDQLGFLSNTHLASALRGLHGKDWLSLVGLVGIIIAFGHSILAMSGEETLAQVYREVESPKLLNFKKAAFIVFVYSLVFTAGISFLAVLLIPDELRLKAYSDNLIGGLAMNVVGPPVARLLLNAFVVGVGFLILAGAVNTAIIGSNGVLNRVAEDGVLSDWFLKPHPQYGTTYRLLYLLVGLQLVAILISRGDVLVLGEAYAFGVVWSFVFKAMAMVILRFKRPEPRQFKVPLNIRAGRYELPVGLGLIFLVLLAAAMANLLTKKVATEWGLGFTVAVLTMFLISERYRARRQSTLTEHVEQFNQEAVPELTPAGLKLTKPNRKLVAIRSAAHLDVLDAALKETDAETTDIIVMKAKLTHPDGTGAPEQDNLDVYDQQLMTAVVTHGEAIGKQVHPLIVPTNHPLDAILRTAKSLQVQQLILGATPNRHIQEAVLGSSRRITPQRQLARIEEKWAALHDGRPAPLSVCLVVSGVPVSIELGGPKSTSS
jgi:hypothetical protein